MYLVIEHVPGGCFIKLFVKLWMTLQTTGNVLGCYTNQILNAFRARTDHQSCIKSFVTYEQLYETPPCSYVLALIHVHVAYCGIFTCTHIVVTVITDIQVLVLKTSLDTYYCEHNIHVDDIILECTRPVCIIHVFWTGEKKGYWTLII